MENFLSQAKQPVRRKGTKSILEVKIPYHIVHAVVDFALVIFKERKEKGEYHTLVKETMLFDHEYFFRIFRMTPRKYEELCKWLAPFLLHSNIRRETISPQERLCVTLRFLVTGDVFAMIAHSYRMSETISGSIVNDTCEVIWNVLKDKGFLKVPANQNEWIKIAMDFEARWNFPNCVGAID